MSINIVPRVVVPFRRGTSVGSARGPNVCASSRRRQRWPLAFVLIGLALLLFNAEADGTSYAITNVVDSAGPFKSFGVAPAVSANGTVAFMADLDIGGFGIFTVDDGSTTKIAEVADGYLSFEDPAINATDDVAFWVLFEGGASGVLVSSGGHITIIADTNGSWANFGGLTPAINVDDTVAFWAGLDSGRTGIYATNGGPITTIADDAGEFWIFGSPAINAGGTVAFWSLYDGGTSSGIYTGVGGPSTTIADTFGPWSKFGEAAINDAGTVAFRADLDVGGSGIFAASGSTINTVVDSSGPFKSFKDPRIGGDGSVAFAGFLDDGQSGIFTGSDPVTDKVVQTGDPLFESTVTGYTALNFFGNVNDSGVLAFWYGLTNGVTGIALAQPAAPFLDADFDEDGDVDGDDLTLWQAGYGSGTLHSQGDADGDGDVDGRDFLTWQRQVSSAVPVAATVAVPEPVTCLLLAAGIVALASGIVRVRWQAGDIGRWSSLT